MVEFTIFKGSKEGKITKGTTKREVGEDEVLIKVTHSGLCGTDEHYKHADMCLGHEGVGIVEDFGRHVKELKKGDVVGWGYQHGSCGSCKQCLTGHETLCAERSMYGYSDFDQGSFATHAIWPHTFVHPIPSTMLPEHAAPLQCGGATVYNALTAFGTKSGQHIGIIGVGGLGHLAIQFAHHMGCHVTVFSSTDSKKKEALELGADDFIATKGLTSVPGLKIDHLLVTSSFQPDWSLYLPLMAPMGTIYPLSVSEGNLVIPYMPLLASELKIQGVLVSTRQQARDMLDFAARKGIKPIIEKFAMSVEGIEAGMEKLRVGDMRYRGVLVV